MKLSLKFIVIFVTSLLVSLPVFEFYSPPSAQALVSSGYWTKRTPKTGTGFNTDAEYTNMGHWGTYYSAHTPFAELIETLPASQGGGRVIHWFLGIPSMGLWGQTQVATIFHSSNQGANWNRITPTGIFGGQMEFIVVPEPWHTNNDPSQSRWNGKLLLYTNKTANTYPLAWYMAHRPALFRYDGDGFTNNWTNLINENIPGFNDHYALGTSYYNMYGVYGKAFQSFLQIFNNQLYLVSWRLTSPTGENASRWRIVVQTFDGTFSQLINAPSSVAWTHKWQSDEYSNWSYQAPTYCLFFEKINDYLFLGTGPFANASPFNIPNAPGIMYQSDSNGENFAHNLPAPMTGRVMSDLSPLGVLNRSNLSFTIQIGGVNYTAYATVSGAWPYSAGDTTFVMFGQDYWGYYMYYNWDWIAPGYGDYLWRGYWMDMWGWSGTGGNVAFTYSSINHTTREVWVSMIEPTASAGPSPIVVPMTMIEFKGYAYAGFAHNSGNISGWGTGKVRRTNRFTDEDDNPNTFVDTNRIPNANGFANWDDCGRLVDYDYNIWDRDMTNKNSAVLSFLKTRVPATGGGLEDDLLFIGGSSQGWFTGAAVNTLFVTEGYDQFGNENLPLEFTLHEDEWNYDRDNPTRHYRGINPDWMYNIYSMKNTSIGMLVFIATPRLRLDEGYGQRYFHILNAAPSLRIEHEPTPVIVERGQTADILFELTPLGGFGSAGFRMQLLFDSTGMFLPAQDPLGNPYTENQLFSTRMDTQGPLLFFDDIPWYANPTLRTTISQPLGIFDAKLIVTDQLLGMTVEYEFRIQVIPPRPGFSVSVIPSTRQLYAGETVCFDVNLESRFDFEDNVIVGIFWQTEPPQNDTSFEWMDSTYIYDRLDDTMVEVITRRNIGTQYQFCLHTEKTVSPGNFEFMLMFFSTVETRTANVRVRILPPRPTFTISTNPRIGKTVPGGIVHYDITIESIDNYVGPVSLFIENLPVTVEMVRLTPTTVNLSLANPIAYAELVLQTFSATYAPHRPTNFFARVISRSVVNLSWESSRRGTHEIAGYEIWRGPNQYIERANRIAIVGPNVVSYDDAEGIESGRNYYYFLRAFDNQAPPNYSDFVPSNEARVARSGNIDTIKPQAIVGTGTLPGYYRFLVSGDGIGMDEYGQSFSFSVTANTDLLVFRSIDEMKTPGFDFWGIALLMFGLMGFVLFQHKKKRWESN